MGQWRLLAGLSPLGSNRVPVAFFEVGWNGAGLEVDIGAELNEEGFTDGRNLCGFLEIYYQSHRAEAVDAMKVDRFGFGVFDHGFHRGLGGASLDEFVEGIVVQLCGKDHSHGYRAVWDC